MRMEGKSKYGLRKAKREEQRNACVGAGSGNTTIYRREVPLFAKHKNQPIVTEGSGSFFRKCVKLSRCLCSQAGPVQAPHQLGIKSRDEWIGWAICVTGTKICETSCFCFLLKMKIPLARLGWRLPLLVRGVAGALSSLCSLVRQRFDLMPKTRAISRLAVSMFQPYYSILCLPPSQARLEI